MDDVKWESHLKKSAPTLIIHGSKDPLFPLSQARYLKEHIPPAELVIVEDAGHETPRETPEKIWDAIEKFIDS